MWRLHLVWTLTEDFNYTKFRRYVDKALWSASKSERDSFGSQFAPLVVDGAPADSSPAVTPTEIVVDSSPTSIHISSIDVKLSNGLRLTVDSPSLDSLIDVLRKLLVDMVSIRVNRIITCTPAIWKVKSSDELRTYYLVIVNYKMDPFEKIKQIEAELNTLLELKSRSQCQDELYAFALERLEFYHQKNEGKTVPSILKGISKGGVISDELFNSYMEEQYQEFCKYLRDCMDEASVEYEKIGQRNEEWEREHRK